MKFGHSYVSTLENEGFPSQWVRSAISYRQLKKCIKRVQSELLSLGLSPDVLNRFWLEDDGLSEGDDHSALARVGFAYSLRECKSSASLRPVLTFAMGPDDKPPSDLLPYPAIAHTDATSITTNSSRSSTSSTNPCTSNCDKSCTTKTDTEAPYQSVQIPLSSDSEFFRLLRTGLSNLEDLQAHEKRDLDNQVVLLRDSIVEVTSPSSKKADQAAIYAWREVFRIYMEMQVFFSTGEVDGGERSSEVARHRLEAFQTQLVKEHHAKKLGRNGRRILETFMHINLAVLQNLRFQEINGMALNKILKKFDKQTALHARSAFTHTGPFSAQSLSRSVCQAITEQILVVVPQLDDYLCPVCFTISFKPVKLKCSHVFCIRCLIIMQRAQQDHCPMCRAQVVMEATSKNLDHKLLDFLQASFPKETKAKQRENERAAMVDVYGEPAEACNMM
ncbi:RING-14 protein [Arthroderma uncinatum]|uniref:RING-14 protein n=1 Tax=Arthroderma uncinatum TaxID=74035 RepID=UPI00144ADB60|nr:RING-14 protein [Arthroderma uncinatum]KAF3479978.1 RING-14 protein [Arthroderma uncinatum]